LCFFAVERFGTGDFAPLIPEWIYIVPIVPEFVKEFGKAPQGAQGTAAQPID
jgi:hypothetical protein